MERNAVRIFLDSNVILSGLLSDIGAPRVILDILTLDVRVLKGVTGEYNIREVEGVLRRKLPAAFPVYRKYLPLLNLEIVPLPCSSAVVQAARHIRAKDAPVLVSARDGEVDFLVTGDKKDFASLGRKMFAFDILGPSEFVEDVLPGILGNSEAP